MSKKVDELELGIIGLCCGHKRMDALFALCKSHLVVLESLSPRDRNERIIRLIHLMLLEFDIEGATVEELNPVLAKVSRAAQGYGRDMLILKQIRALVEASIDRIGAEIIPLNAHRDY
jgi:hypothetical protein